jgi:hypothetical protein
MMLTDPAASTETTLETLPLSTGIYIYFCAAEAGRRVKTYDSEADGRARFIGHSAFDDPETPPDAPMRESIEIRTAAFF